VRGTVVLATYNSAGSIEAVLAEVEEAASVLARSDLQLDILLVDNDSPDGTVALAREQALRLDLDLEAIDSPSTHRSAALLVGLRHVLDRRETRFIVTLDANGHHDARQITDLVRAFVARRSGLTIGSRWVSGGSAPGAPRWRAVASRTAGTLVRRASGLRQVRDATTSFWVMAPEVARTMLADDLLEPGFAFYSTFVALTQAYGYTIDEVPISFRPRYSGIDSVSVDDVAEFMRSLPAVRRHSQQIRADMRADQATWASRSSRMLDQEATAGSSFGADAELERLAESDNFFGWIADELVPHLGHRILEVGAGIGTVSLKLLERKPGAQITALEPDPKLHDELVRRTKRHPEMQTLNVTSSDLLQSDMHPTFDSVVYVNVLEHILDDAGELRTAHDLLVPGGTLAIFVPALPRLYGSLDYKSGHHRRYTAEILRTVVEEAGFELADVRYLDLLGVVPYFVMYRLLDVKTLGSVSSTGYDRVVVPLSRAVQRLVPHPPAGKNLLAIARRPHDTAASTEPVLRLAR
jgi:2-polyprenyl-3-methyl-5-hydroxy-6-metoxy-1,4-benzoquinol methylase